MTKQDWVSYSLIGWTSFLAIVCGTFQGVEANGDHFAGGVEFIAGPYGLLLLLSIGILVITVLAASKE
jgi:hypothetical protein